jgi:hypothetical protein
MQEVAAPKYIRKDGPVPCAPPLSDIAHLVEQVRFVLYAGAPPIPDWILFTQPVTAS